MPYHIGKSDECTDGQVAVIKDDDDEVMGCHMSEAAARRQMAALYAQDDLNKSMEHLTLKAVATPTTDQGVFEAVISTETIDREKDIVMPAAMVAALKKWNRPIPLAWNHSSEAKDIFGTIEPMTVRQQDGEVIAQGQVDIESEVGQEAWRSFKSRTIGFSFGYMIPDGGATERKGGGLTINALDVFEITATPTPMNNDTRVLSTKSVETLDQELQQVRDELSQSRQQIQALEKKAEETDREPPARSVDPLRERSRQAVAGIRLDGVPERKSPSKTKQEPAPDSRSDRELRREFREMMIEQLRS